MRVRLLVGRLDDEDGFVVAGAIDESIYEVAGDDVDGWAPERIRDSWPAEYEWREVIVKVDERLLRGHFDTPEVPAIPQMPA